MDEEIKKIIRPCFDEYGLLQLREQADEITKKIAQALSKHLDTKIKEARIRGLRCGQGIYMNKIARKDFLKIIQKAIDKVEAQLKEELDDR